MTVRSFKKRILVLSSIGIQSMHFHIPLCVIADPDNLSRWASKYQMFWLQIFRNWNFENVVTSVIFLWINEARTTMKYVKCSMNSTWLYLTMRFIWNALQRLIGRQSLLKRSYWLTYGDLISDILTSRRHLFDALNIENNKYF